MDEIAVKIRCLAQKVGWSIREHGWLATFRKGFAYLWGLVYLSRVCRIYRADLETVTLLKQRSTNSVSYRVLHPHDNGPIEQIERMAEWPRGELKERIGGGDICLAALCEGNVLGFQLVTFGEVHIQDVNLRRFFRPEEAWSEPITVRKDFRNRGLASQMPQEIFEELRQRGVSRLYSGSLLPNEAARKLARRAGFLEIADITYIRLFGLEYRRCKKIRQPMRSEIAEATARLPCSP